MPYLFMRFPEGKAKSLTLSYDDGVLQDKRLKAILDKNGIKCTFNINSGMFDADGDLVIHKHMTETDTVALFRNSGHEVAVHGLQHLHLGQLPQNAVTHEISADRKNIETLFGTVTRGMAYAFGRYNDDVVRSVRDCGIVYARTVENSGTFDIPTDWLRLHPTCHHDDPHLWDLTERFVGEFVGNEPWLFYLWGHSHEFDRNDNWNRIETFAARAGGHEDVWYATNIEVYDYVEAFRALQFSSDMSLVYNPSAQTVWFLWDDTLHRVAGGETKTL